MKEKEAHIHNTGNKAGMTHSLMAAPWQGTEKLAQEAENKYFKHLQMK